MDPQTFYIVKGIAGVIGVSLLVFYMDRHWHKFDEHGGIAQRLRFFTLFYFAVLLTSASYEQVVQNVQEINLRNVGGLVGAILMIVTALVSIREAQGTQHPHTRK